MSVKLPDKGQWVFIGLVMCLVTYYAGSVAVYFFNHKTPCLYGRILIPCCSGGS